MSGQDDGNRDSRPSPGEKKPLEAEIVDEGVSWSSVGGSQSGRRGPVYFSRRVTFAPIDNSGCAAALITLVFFLFSSAQWGLLAGIGFVVFHTIGNVIASVYSARRLMRGLAYNIWSLRIINWAGSFFLTAWLSGGLK